MILFRFVLVAILLALTVYTGVVIANHGWGLLSVFVGDILAMTWSGQFNVDFLGFLTLSAIWTSWRHDFSAPGLVLGIIAFFGGMMFLAVYLLVAGTRARGDVRILLLGARRATA